MLADFIFAVAGLGALLAAGLPAFTAGRPFSVPLAFLGCGVLLAVLPLSLPEIDPVAHASVVEHTTEVVVIISLMGAGLALDRPIGWRRWNTTWRLIGVAMPLTILGTAAVGHFAAGLPVAAALLLGAVLAPTDPVLAGDVQVGAPTEEEHSEDEVRFSLTAEAGLNDGAAFPVVYAAIAIAAAGLDPGGWLGEWLLRDVAYKTAVGLAGGLAVGWLLGRMFFRVRATTPLSEHSDGFVALAATFTAYGLTELAQGYGFVAVFVAACMIRRAEATHGYHHVLHGFTEQVERLLTAWLLLLLGGAIGSGLLGPLTWGGAAVGIALVLLIRPASAYLALLGSPAGRWERPVIGFYGIRGIGSLYYLAYATGHGTFPAEELWAIVGFTVLFSVIVHGSTATPVVGRLDRRRSRLAHAGMDGTPTEADIAAHRV